MHVFPYSVRTGTAAARWKQLPHEIIQDRVQQLLNLDSTLSLAFFLISINLWGSVVKPIIHVNLGFFFNTSGTES